MVGLETWTNPLSEENELVKGHIKAPIPTKENGTLTYILIVGSSNCLEICFFKASSKPNRSQECENFFETDGVEEIRNPLYCLVFTRKSHVAIAQV